MPPARALPAALVLLLLLSACGDSNGGTGPGVAPVASVELTAPADAIEEGATLQLSVSVRDDEGNELSGREITFTSSDESVATVSGTGLVTGVAPGEVTLTARSEGKASSLELAVREGGPLPVELSGTYRRVRFEVAEGATHSVTGDLTVFADELIDIRGKLDPEPGVSIALVSDGDLLVSGEIGDSADVADDSALLAGETAASTGANADDAGDHVLLGNQINIGGDIRAEDPGQGVIIAGLSPAPNIVIEATVRAGTGGRDETGAGLEGGSIHIGSATAKQRAQELGKTVEDFVQVTIDGAFIEAGLGGSGASKEEFDDVTGQLATVATRPGGPGGDLSIRGISVILLNDPFIRAGPGGAGGSVGSFITEPLRAPDGEEPGEKGVSVEVVTGRGGDGGDLTIEGSREGGFEGGPGGGGQGSPLVLVGPGSGGPGGDGGDASIQVGRWGDSGTGPGAPVFSILRPLVVLTDGNGGTSESPEMSGGNGGKFTVSLIPGGDLPPDGFPLSVASPHPYTFGSGGLGFDACNPVGAGSKGGAGGLLAVITAEGTPSVEVDLVVSLRGGNGGDGIPPGARGAGGSGTINGEEVEALQGSPGSDGGTCPLAATVDRTEIAFSHTVEVTPCPQEIGTFTLTNVGAETLTWEVVSGANANALEASALSGTLEPGAETTVLLQYKCNKNDSFTAEFDVVVSASGEPSQAFAMKVDGQLLHRAVRLDHALGATFTAGQEIRLSRIQNGSVTPAEQGCDEEHLHAVSGSSGITIDGEGPFADPNRNGCGYGVIVLTEGGG